MAALWTVFTALSALTGVEPIRSLAARTEGEGGGLMLVLSCAAIVVTGVGVDADLRERTRRWFVVATCIVGALGLVFRFAPDVLTDTVGLKTLSFVGATMGNQLFAAALLAAGIAAALVPGKRLRNQVVVVAFLALGAATFGERSSLVLPAVAVVVTLWRSRMPWRSTIALGATVGVVLLGWQTPDPVLPGREADVGAALAPLQGQATDADRAVVWKGDRRRIARTPDPGMGTGTTQVPYLTRATPADIEEADPPVGRRPQPVPGDDRDLGDPRADPARGAVRAADRAGVASGSGAGVVPGCRRRPGRLCHGRAAQPGPRRPCCSCSRPWRPGFALGSRTRRSSGPKGVRLGVGIVLCLSLVVSLTMIAGATFERWGREYGEEWAYRAALRVQPWRLTSTEQPRAPARRAGSNRRSAGRCRGEADHRRGRRALPVGRQRSAVGRRRRHPPERPCRFQSLAPPARRALPGR